MAINPFQQCTHCCQVLHLPPEHLEAIAASPPVDSWEVQCPICGEFTDVTPEGHTPVLLSEWVAYPPAEWFGPEDD